MQLVPALVCLAATVALIPSTAGVETCAEADWNRIEWQLCPLVLVESGGAVPGADDWAERLHADAAQ